MQALDRHTHHARFAELADLLSSGIDPDFDLAGEELEREFQELRLQFSQFA
jgi:hypothetical protein